MNRKAFWIGLLLFMGGMIISSTATAQFTYGGIRLSYHNVRFDKGVDFEGTRINDLAVNFDLVHRFLRNFGIGMSARMPIIHGFKYQYIDEKYGNNIVGGGSFNESKVEYAGGELEYNIKNTYSLTFLGRVYFDTETNYFVDFRYSMENYLETFIFDRSGQSLPDKQIDFEKSLTASGIGFSIGAQPKIDDHFYINYVFTVDFLTYDQNSFDYDIESYSNSLKSNISSKIPGDQTAYEFSMGIGYIF